MLIKTVIVICFIICLFHIFSFYKVNNQLEIIDIATLNSRERYEKLLRLKQPLKFRMYKQIIIDEMVKNKNELILVKNVGDNKYNKVKYSEIDDYLKTEKTKYSDNNKKFIEEKIDKSQTIFLKPKLGVYSRPDIIIGNKTTIYPIKKQTYDTNIFFMLSGKCKITLFSPNNDTKAEINNKLLETTIKNNNSVLTSYKYVECELNQGDYLSIPPLWFIKVDFFEFSHIINFCYHTPFTILSNSYNIFQHVVDIYNKDN